MDPHACGNTKATRSSSPQASLRRQEQSARHSLCATCLHAESVNPAHNKLRAMGRGIVAFIVVLLLTGSVGWAVLSCMGAKLL